MNTARSLKEHGEYADGGEISSAMGNNGQDPRKLMFMKLLQHPQGRQFIEQRMRESKQAAPSSESFKPTIGLGGYIQGRNNYVNERIGGPSPYQKWTAGQDGLRDYRGEAAPDNIDQLQKDWQGSFNSLTHEYEGTLDPRELQAIRQEMLASDTKDRKRFNTGKGITLAMIGAMAGGAASAAAGAAGANSIGSQIANRAASSGVKYAASGRADGGVIEGPGTGVSDSIPGFGPDGPISVSDGEYIVPADVVLKKGTDFFDKLVEQNHTPAEMQRAMGINSDGSGNHPRGIA